MHGILKSFGAVGVSLLMATASFVPAQAMSVNRPSVPAASTSAETPIKVQDRRVRIHSGPGYRGDHRRGYYRDHRGHRYYNGHRGYRDYRRGYRRHNDAWFPAAAFLGGAIIGGAIASQPGPAPRARSGNNHVQWCYDRYRSYRASDNTFQPYNGPRRQCYSPYR